MTRKKSFTEGKLYVPLVKFTLPLLFAMFLQALYGAGDMLIIGIFGSTRDVSAVATGTGIIDLARMLLSAMSVGTTVLLGQQIGRGDDENCGVVVGTSIWLFLILGITISFLLFFPASLWASLLQAPFEAFVPTVQYTQICAVGTVFVSLYAVLGSIFRGLGDSKTPLIIVTSTFVLNFIGDIFLVGYLKMGASGSALTNVLAQALSVLLCVLVMKHQRFPFSFSRNMIRCDLPCLKELVRIGFPMALQDILVSISFLVITAIVNSLGLVASAGVGVAERICGFVMLIPSSFGQALSAFVAHNIGAGKPQRAKKAMLYGMLTSFGVGLFVGWFSFFHGDILAGLFAGGKSDVIAAAADYLRAYAIDCLLTAFMFCFTGYFTGLGRTRFVMIAGIISAFAVRVPVSWLMSQMQPVSLFHVGLATPFSTILQIIFYVCYLIFLERKEIKTIPLAPNSASDGDAL